MKNGKLIFGLFFSSALMGAFWYFFVKVDVYTEKLNFTPRYYCSETQKEKEPLSNWGSEFCDEPLILVLKCHVDNFTFDPLKKNILRKSCKAIQHEMNMSGRFSVFVDEVDALSSPDGQIDASFTFRKSYRDTKPVYGDGYFDAVRVEFVDFNSGKEYKRIEPSDGLRLTQRAAITSFIAILNRIYSQNDMNK